MKSESLQALGKPTWWLAALLFSLSGPAQAQPGERHDAVEVVNQRDLLELRWSDTEDTLKGSIRPDPPVAGEELTVSVRVGSFQGAPFEGPVTLALRPEGGRAANPVTVTPKDGTWVATFVPEQSGPHTLDIGFQTTRHKQLRAPLVVTQSPIPRYFAWALMAAIVLGSVGYGVYRQVRRPTEQRSAEAEPPAAS